MNAYETLFIVRATLTDDEPIRIIDKVKEVIPKFGGEVVASENWGRRKLNYEIKKEKKGIYVMLHFKGEGATVRELEQCLRLDEMVLKFLTVVIAQDNLGKTAPIKEDKPFARDRAASGKSYASTG